MNLASFEVARLMAPVLAFGVCLASNAAQAAGVGLSGVFGSRAVIVTDDDRLHTLRVGQATADGMRLVSVGTDSAVVEIGGVRQTLRLGERVVSAASEGTAQRVMIEGDSQGHFLAQGSVNGASMRFLVDTGATAVSMGAADARRAGIDFRQGRQAYSQTANGVAPIWIVKLNSVRLGGIELAGVDAAIHEGDMPVVLLGMSFLNRMQMSREGNRLILERRY
ncbi:TIGR02281 family clan AA aspartic protease [Thauera sp. Sel9]|uniref:TIGR02281 family clan AA aspartic protease n=1 Tax=Thauera sp. Sel9 TaxID=2974299 RepID=UPI0021E1A47F|nr:TIGR02281 family clan AA aspartic protease [Thauera sp. Sel9]MCV2217925.1 TIGR02281 family clan AA aspartic protease [Thauera sp. Sel9]